MISPVRAALLLASAMTLAAPAEIKGQSAQIPVPHKVELGTGVQTKVAPVVPVPLGAGGAANPPTPRPQTIMHDAPSEECNRSSADWPDQPIRIAVLDFRYPVEREEAHDLGSASGGPGMAVADLVFARMETLEQQDPRFAFSRGDRRRLDRSDFAGAARLGRQLGADAVLTGTLFPVISPAPAGLPDALPITTYELHSGLVDTCTGQLLLRLSSVSCPQSLTPGLDPSASGPGAVPCTRFAVSSEDSADPQASATAFQPALSAMLFPLEHNDTPRQPNGSLREGSAGIVIAVQVTPTGTSVSLRLPPQARVSVGDQVAVHAWRLAKNPASYTLHALHDEEIGRVTITGIQGKIATGAFVGSFPPRTNDTVEIFPPL